MLLLILIKFNESIFSIHLKNAILILSSYVKKMSLSKQKNIHHLVAEIKYLISEARTKVLKTVDTVQVNTYWQIGKYIVEYEQQGEKRAEYGKNLINQLAQELTGEFGKGFDARNLRNMRAFYQQFDNWNALRTELSWTHYRTLLAIDNMAARNWYMNECADQNWSTRALSRQVNSLYYERLLSSKDKQPVIDEANLNIRPLQTPRDFVREPVILEFLGLPESGKFLENTLEQALIDKLQNFLLELGKGFAFVARQKRISTQTKDFYVDLVFYNYILKCFVLIELKTGELSHQDIGQIDMYVRMFDELERNEGDNPTVGIILCSDKDAAIAHYSILSESEQIFASKYKTILPSVEELKAELEREKLLLEELKKDR